MHTAIIYYNHDKFAVLYYNESNGDWEVSLDKLFENSTTTDSYEDIMCEFMEFLYDFNCCSECKCFDFLDFVHDYDSDFYMVEVK